VEGGTSASKVHLQEEEFEIYMEVIQSNHHQFFEVLILNVNHSRRLFLNLYRVLIIHQNKPEYTSYSAIRTVVTAVIGALWYWPHYLWARGFRRSEIL
jgi:hypothetical protein